MVNSCVAYGCNVEYIPHKTVSFFGFPFKRPEILELWVKAIGRENWTPSKSSKLCSNHFLPSDFIPRQASKMKILKPDAVPSVFDFPKQLQEETTLSIMGKKEIDETECAMDSDMPSTSLAVPVLKTFADKATQVELMSPNDFILLRRKIKTLQQEIRRKDVKIARLKEIIKEIKNSGYNNEKLVIVVEK